jgi:GTPase
MIRKGVVLISPKSEKLAVKTFIAKVDVMKSHSTTIKEGYEPLFCLNSIRQTVRILEIKDKKNSRNVINDDNVLRTNDNAMIKLRFKYRPEYIKVNSRFIMCENHLKIVGEIIEIL